MARKYFPRGERQAMMKVVAEAVESIRSQSGAPENMKIKPWKITRLVAHHRYFSGLRYTDRIDLVRMLLRELKRKIALPRQKAFPVNGNQSQADLPPQEVSTHNPYLTDLSRLLTNTLTDELARRIGSTLSGEISDQIIRRLQSAKKARENRVQFHALPAALSHERNGASHAAAHQPLSTAHMVIHAD